MSDEENRVGWRDYVGYLMRGMESDEKSVELSMSATTGERGRGILLGSLAQDALKDALKDMLIEPAISKMMKLGNPISTFSAQIDLASAVGLIQKTGYDDLHLIRRIRNKCAHDYGAWHHTDVMPLSFSRSPLIDLCRNLKTPEAFSATIFEGRNKVVNNDDLADAFMRYTISCIGFARMFEARITI